MKQVVITSFGCVTPIGSSYDTIHKALREGLSGIRKIEKYNTKSLYLKYAGIPFEGNKSIQWPRKGKKFSSGDIFYINIAAKKLLKNPTFALKHYNPKNIGCFLGQDAPEIDFEHLLYNTIDVIKEKIQFNREDLNNKYFVENVIMSRFPYRSIMNTKPISVMNKLSSIIPFSGFSFGNNGLCSASLHAIGAAYNNIKSGRLKAAIAGGITAKVAIGYHTCIEANRIFAIKEKEEIQEDELSRPFDKFRCGYVPGEGAVLFFLEDYEAVKKRNDEALIEIISYGSSLNAYHIVKPEEHSHEIISCMTRALKNACLSPENIDLVNAHGTSTILNDYHESKAINKIFGDKILVTANKSIHGHMNSAAGSMEILNSIISNREGFIPATLNTKDLDPKCEINLVRENLDYKPRYIMKNSFGMGGLASSIILKNLHK